jgi:hypothetical protein
MSKEDLEHLHRFEPYCPVENFYFIDLPHVLKIILSSSRIYHIGTTCDVPFLLIVPNFPVKVPRKRKLLILSLVISGIAI